MGLIVVYARTLGAPLYSRRAFLVPSLFDLYIHCSGMSLLRARVPLSMEGRSTSSKVLWTS